LRKDSYIKRDYMSSLNQKISSRIRDIIKKYLNDLLSAFEKDIMALVLFGSWARGDARSDSDIDILCISSEKMLMDIFLKTSEFNADLMLKDINNRINLHFVPIEKLDFSKDNEYVLLFYASKEGMPLYGTSFWNKVKSWVLKTSYLVGYT